MKELMGYPLPLGVSERNGIVNFSVAVPEGKVCFLCLYKKGAKEATIRQELTETVGHVRYIAFPKAKVRGMEYNYEIDGKVVLDSYVKSIRNGQAEPRGKVLLDTYDWEGDRPLELPYHEVIAYSLHVKGFTKHRSAKVKGRGTFRGVIGKIPHLLELGVNQIQCMPIYAFCDTPQYHNYWGYGDAFCFAVKQEYASGKNPEKEFKDMVKACHKHGIEVVLHLPFTEQTPKQLMEECLRYYVLEYHVDGFILNPYIAPMQSICQDPILQKTKILHHRDDFQNTMRRFLRGDAGQIPGVTWWLRQLTKESGSCNYITGHTGFTLADLVSYREKHNEANGENNYDGPGENYSCNYGVEGTTEDKKILALRRRQRRNAFFLMMSAQGTPCILAGDEFGNSQGGNNNVYCQDNETAWLNWDNQEQDRVFFEYVKQVIALRKKYDVLSGATALTGRDRWGCGVPDVSYHGSSAWKVSEHKNNRQLGVYYHSQDGGNYFIAYNMYSKEQVFALPNLSDKKQWYCVFSTADEDGMPRNDLQENQKETMVDGRTIVMFVGK